MIGVDGTNSHLLDVLLMSEKRKNVALLLSNGPKTSDEIKSILELSSSSVMPQIKILKQNNIVVQKKHTYYLSQIGHLLVHHMIPLLGMSNTLEQNLDYWIEHDISKLPLSFQLRLCEFGDCDVVRPEPEAPHEFPVVLKKSVASSNDVYIVSSFFQPYLIEVYKKLDKKGVNVIRISTRTAFNKLIEKYVQVHGSAPSFKNIKFYIFEGSIDVPAVILTNGMLSLLLYTKKGIFPNNFMISGSDGALKWGMDYFNYYLERSKPVDLAANLN